MLLKHVLPLDGDSNLGKLSINRALHICNGLKTTCDTVDTFYPILSKPGKLAVERLKVRREVEAEPAEQAASTGPNE